MRLPTLLAAALLCVSAPLALAANPVGHYLITGQNPGGGDTYKGTADVTKTGDTYHVVWTIDGTKYIGTAIGDKNFMAITYRSGNDTGLALYGDQGDDWAGIWTYADGRTLGTEHWTRQ